ncbi:MAG: ATP-binding cassette domain-containing protein [Eubacterium sp.]|nr:ATP-binding cassette domain-containing protein [Eubacterium sp.]
MSLLKVSDLTFGYEGSFDNIFENISFSVDTDWKLGFIGRNGKGKTTFLNLLLGKYEYSGSIITDTHFDYFPYRISENELDKTADELCEVWKPGVENWRVVCELNNLGVDPELLYRPVRTLSFGERTKVMLAVLFSGENEFLLIDEPTNHLDKEGREVIKKYLNSKKGFILVSHDRDLLDAVADHMLVLNRESIEVVAGNFSSWWENKEKADAYAMAENEKHQKEIGKLRASADRAGRWADKNEATKIGYDPVKEHDRCISTRSYIGAKTKKMQSRVKNFEKRIDREIEEKEGLLKDIEKTDTLKLMPLQHHKKILVECRDFSLAYGQDGVSENQESVKTSYGNDGQMDDTRKSVFKNITFQLKQGDILFLNGENGCGKSSLIKAILRSAGMDVDDWKTQDEENSNECVNEEEVHKIDSRKNVNIITSGRLETASGLIISYIDQNTSHLKGSLKDYAKEQGLDYSLLLTLLRKLDMSRVQFEKKMEDYSEGQKKKVLIAASLLTCAHVYIWDEPMNYIDVFSRMQIEKLIEEYKPTMIVVEHDVRFRDKLATAVLDFSSHDFYGNEQKRRS